jgi:hypothetical protein
MCERFATNTALFHSVAAGLVGLAALAVFSFALEPSWPETLDSGGMVVLLVLVGSPITAAVPAAEPERED